MIEIADFQKVPLFSDRKMKRIVKNIIKPRLILPVLIVVTILALSFFYSREVYSFYMQIYYGLIKADEYELYIHKAEELYQAEENRAFEKLITRLLAGYPGRRGPSVLAGQYYLKNGNFSRGARLLSEALTGTGEDRELLGVLVPELYKSKMYSDIVAIVSVYTPQEIRYMGGLSFYYGVALYHREKYAEAEVYLTHAEKMSARNDLFHYLALTKEKLALSYPGEGGLVYLEGAAFYMKMALAGYEQDPVILGDYVRILKKLGRVDEAAEVLGR